MLEIPCGGGLVCIAGPSPSTQHPSIHASINGVPTNRPINQATTWPNQQTKQPKPPIPALCPPLHPPAFIYTASIHPSIHQTSTHSENIAYPSSTVPRKQSRQAYQQTSKQKTISLSMIHASLYVFSPNPSKQQAKQAEPTNTPSKGSGVKKKGWVAHQATSKPSNQAVFSQNAVDTCFALVAHQATNKPSNQNHTTLCFPQMLSIFGLHYNKLAKQPTHQAKEGG